MDRRSGAKENAFMYIEAMYDQDGLKYDAYLVNFESKSQKKVKKVPVIFGGFLDDITKERKRDVEKIESIEIIIKASNQSKTDCFVAVQISIKEKN